MFMRIKKEANCKYHITEGKKVNFFSKYLIQNKNKFMKNTQAINQSSPGHLYKV
jgi:hypothetical protein